MDLSSLFLYTKIGFVISVIIKHLRSKSQDPIVLTDKIKRKQQQNMPNAVSQVLILEIFQKMCFQSPTKVRVPGSGSPKILISCVNVIRTAAADVTPTTTGVDIKSATKPTEK